MTNMAGVTAADVMTPAVVGTGRTEGVKAIRRLPPGGALLRFEDLNINLAELRAIYSDIKGRYYE
jgi:hypothetical protein